MRTIAVINAKGGCGKTTVAINLAASFAAAGLQTLLVDLDTQSHCAAGLAVPESCIENDISQVLPRPDDVRINDVVWQVASRLDLAPALPRLALAEQKIATQPDRETRLVRALARTGTRYEICVVDCPPNLGLMTCNALRAADEVLMPTDMGFFALRSLMQQAPVLQRIADRAGHAPSFRILPNMVDAKSKAMPLVLAELKHQFGACVWEEMGVAADDRVRQASGLGQSVLDLSGTCAVAKRFVQLSKALTERTHKVQRLVQALQADPRVEPLILAHAPAVPAAPSRVPKPDPAPPQTPARPATTGMDRLADLLKRAQALTGRHREPALAAAQAK